MKKLLPAAALALALTPALVACGSDDAGNDTAADSGTTAAAETTEAAALTLTDPWVKAAVVEDGMTAAFGTLVNDSDSDITVVSVANPASGVTELHETVQNDDGSMAMQPKDGGFVIPAGGSHVLEPGGDHIMLMELAAPLEAGTTLTLTLTLDDGSTVDVEATVKPFDGADENYQDGEMDMGGES